jgi:uncharacterized lipoprotein YajG
VVYVSLLHGSRLSNTHSVRSTRTKFQQLKQGRLNAKLYLVGPNSDGKVQDLRMMASACRAPTQLFSLLSFQASAAPVMAVRSTVQVTVADYEKNAFLFLHGPAIC